MSEASSIPSWARVGAKVVYIGCPEYRLPHRLGYAVDALPQIGLAYTIRDLKAPSNGPFIRLGELRVSGKWPDGTAYNDAWLHIRAFRPPVDDATETILYRAMGLKSKSPVRESERA